MSRTPLRITAGFAVFGFAALGAVAPAHADPIETTITYDCTSLGGWEGSGDIEWMLEPTNGDSFDPGDQARVIASSGNLFMVPDEDHGNVAEARVRHEVDLTGGAATDDKLTFTSTWTGSAPVEAFGEDEEGGEWVYPSQPRGTRAGDGSALVFNGGTVVTSMIFDDGEHVVTTCTPTGDTEIARVAVSGQPDPEEPEDPGDEDPGDGNEKPGDGDEDPGDGDEKPGDGDETPGDGDDKGDDKETPDDGEDAGDDPGKGDDENGDSGDGDKGDDKPAPGGDDAADGGRDGSLPVTGAALGGMVAAAVAAVGGGGAAMYLSRKKKAAATGTDA